MQTAGVGAPDGTLVERVRRGDAAAFEALVRRHYRAAYAVALSLLGNGMDAEDVCQDAFVRALERIDDCRRPDRFAAWLLRIVRNRAHNYREYRRVREAADVEAVPAAGSQDSGRDLERSDLRGRLEDALGQISEIQRQVVLLHDLEEMKHRDIAEILGISEGMSRQHLFNARKALRAMLGAEALREHFND